MQCAERIARIPELQTVLTAESRRPQAQAQVDAWNTLRGPGLPPLRVAELHGLELPGPHAGALASSTVVGQ